MTYATREEWLEAAVSELSSRVFGMQDYDVPPVSVSVGFPSSKALGMKTRVVGECWPRKASDDGKNQIFISPLLDNPEKSVGVLAHELVHAIDDCENGHKKAFVKICDKVGLTEGPPKSRAPGQELLLKIERIVKELGDFPAAPLHAIGKDKKQTTRMLKVICPECGYTVRTTASWLRVGNPTCVCGTEMQPTEPVPEGDPAVVVGTVTVHGGSDE